MRVEILAEAKSDLIEIGDYISRDNPARAMSFVRELLTKCRELSDLGTVFPLVLRNKNDGLRRRPFGRYLIFYRIREDLVEVIHILHAKRDYEALLFPDD